MSCFVKKTTGTPSNYPAFEIGALGTYLSIDTTNGVAQETSGGPNYSNINVESYGDYWRVSATCTPAAGTQFLRIWAALGSTLGAVNSNATGSATFYGFQVEASSYPTSYVPTYGSATARAKDHFLMLLETAGITSSGQTEATLFIEFEKPNTGENIDLMRFRGTGILGRGYIYNTGAGFASDWGQSLTFNTGENVKAVWRVNSLTDGEAFVNGTKSPNASGTAWSGFWTIRFNEEGGGGVLKIKQIALFNTALTDAECTALTT